MSAEDDKKDQKHYAKHSDELHGDGRDEKHSDELHGDQYNEKHDDSHDIERDDKSGAAQKMSAEEAEARAATILAMHEVKHEDKKNTRFTPLILAVIIFIALTALLVFINKEKIELRRPAQGPEATEVQTPQAGEGAEAFAFSSKNIEASEGMSDYALYGEESGFSAIFNGSSLVISYKADATATDAVAADATEEEVLHVPEAVAELRLLDYEPKVDYPIVVLRFADGRLGYVNCYDLFVRHDKSVKELLAEQQFSGLVEAAGRCGKQKTFCTTLLAINRDAKAVDLRTALKDVVKPLAAK